MSAAAPCRETNGQVASSADNAEFAAQERSSYEPLRAESPERRGMPLGQAAVYAPDDDPST